MASLTGLGENCKNEVHRGGSQRVSPGRNPKGFAAIFVA